MEFISCYFFLFLVWIPLIIIFFVPALFSKIFVNINNLERTKHASNNQLDAGAHGNYHENVQQFRAKNIVAFNDKDVDQYHNDDSDSNLQQMVRKMIKKMNDLSLKIDNIEKEIAK